MSNEEGYLYCLSNPSLKDGLYKIGMTDRTPEYRAKELSRAAGVAAPFKVEFAKKVKNPRKKERHIHSLLEQYENRYSSSREFFEVELNVVKTIFDLLDGDDWHAPLQDQDQEQDQDQKKSRNMRDYFKDNQRIRHKFGIDKIIIGLFNYEKNCITFNGKEFTSLSGFGTHHYKIENKKSISCNGWAKCEVEIDNKWVKIETKWVEK